jgi:hypothetical protein
LGSTRLGLPKIVLRRSITGRAVLMIPIIIGRSSY